jgi:hypothetical protein
LVIKSRETVTAWLWKTPEQGLILVQEEKMREGKMTVKKFAGAVIKYSVVGARALLEIVCDALEDEAKKPPIGQGRTRSGRVEPITYKGHRKVGLYSGEPME